MKHKRMIPSDHHVTANQADHVIAIAERLYPNQGFSWRAGGGTIERAQTLKLLRCMYRSKKGGEIIDPMAALRIREEVGVDGTKRPRPTRGRRKRKPPAAWPAFGSRPQQGGSS